MEKEYFLNELIEEKKIGGKIQQDVRVAATYIYQKMRQIELKTYPFWITRNVNTGVLFSKLYSKLEYKMPISRP